jgi:hypothetical protein
LAVSEGLEEFTVNPVPETKFDAANMPAVEAGAESVFQTMALEYGLTAVFEIVAVPPDKVPEPKVILAPKGNCKQLWAFCKYSLAPKVTFWMKFAVAPVYKSLFTNKL